MSQPTIEFSWSIAGQPAAAALGGGQKYLEVEIPVDGDTPLGDLIPKWLQFVEAQGFDSSVEFKYHDGAEETEIILVDSTVLVKGELKPTRDPTSGTNGGGAIAAAAAAAATEEEESDGNESRKRSRPRTSSESPRKKQKTSEQKTNSCDSLPTTTATMKQSIIHFLWNIEGQPIAAPGQVYWNVDIEVDGDKTLSELKQIWLEWVHNQGFDNTVDFVYDDFHDDNKIIPVGAAVVVKGKAKRRCRAASTATPALSPNDAATTVVAHAPDTPNTTNNTPAVTPH